MLPRGEFVPLEVLLSRSLIEPRVAERPRPMFSPGGEETYPRSEPVDADLPRSRSTGGGERRALSALRFRVIGIATAAMVGDLWSFDELSESLFCGEEEEVATTGESGFGEAEGAAAPFITPSE
jgi:hypothetical protein